MGGRTPGPKGPASLPTSTGTYASDGQISFP
jgi:hypothetical protein